jgi:hypothetical protein
MTATAEPDLSGVVEGFLHYLATGDDPGAVMAEDLVVEMNFPNLSFTLTGKAAMDDARDRVSDHPWVLRPEPAIGTDDGFVLVLEYDAGHEGRDVTQRTINLVTLTDGVVTALKHWCTGPLPR